VSDSSIRALFKPSYGVANSCPLSAPCTKSYQQRNTKPSLTWIKRRPFKISSVVQQSAKFRCMSLSTIILCVHANSRRYFQTSLLLFWDPKFIFFASALQWNLT
jgi:hypothetical protein